MDWQTYEQETAVYRQKLNESLTKENGWLALAGLFWLDEGDNFFGTDESESVVLPLTENHGRLGNLIHDGQKVTMHVTGSVEVYVDGKPVQEMVLQTDTSGQPTMVTIEQVSMMLLQRESALAIRMWDNGRSERHNFAGRNWFPLSSDYRVPATFMADDTLASITMSRSVGADFEMKPAGWVHFELHDEDHAMMAFDGGGGQLFLLFKDGTSGKSSYGAGKYLRTAVNEDGTFTLDFNHAFHPPCYFTKYATCTLPPRQNWLRVPIEAGECK